MCIRDSRHDCGNGYGLCSRYRHLPGFRRRYDRLGRGAQAVNAVLWALIAVPAIAGVSLCLGGRHASRTAGTVAAVVCAVTVMLASVAAAGRPEVRTDFVSSGPMGL